MKIEEYFQTLPDQIISGENVDLSTDSLKEILKFAELSDGQKFYHLGCGNGDSLSLAITEFHAENAVGIDNDEKKILKLKEKLKEEDLTNCDALCQDVLDVNLDDADVILFWFTDETIIENMLKKFETLKDGVKIITLWGPLPGYLPDKVDFPFIINQKPFKKTKNLQEQLLAVFETKCVDFVTAWEFAERYTNAISPPNSENNRFVTIIQSLVIWINAKNLGVACGDEIPIPIKNYMSILREYFNIEIDHLLK